MWEIIEVTRRVAILCGIPPWGCHALGRWAFLGPTRVGRLGRVASKYNTSEFIEKKSQRRKKLQNMKVAKASPLSHLEEGSGHSERLKDVLGGGPCCPLRVFVGGLGYLVRVFKGDSGHL
jgi:hypothetical protein